MYEIVSPELEERLVDEAVRQRYLLLDRHPDFAGHWIVESFSDDYLFDLGEVLGSYRALAPAGLQRFLEAAEDGGYHVAFFEDPATALEDYRHLDLEPEVEINSTFPNTIKGMLPYQVQGFNMVKDLDYAVMRWDTGPQPLDAKILTPTGWTTMGELQPGMQVIGGDGTACRVTAVHPRGEQDVYQLTFRDGSVAESTLDHLWGFHSHTGRYWVRPLREFLDAGLYYEYKRRNAKWYVDRPTAIEYHTGDRLPVDPYLLGALLGDGSLTGSVPQFYSHEGECVPLVQAVLPSGIRVSRYGAKHFALVADSAPFRNPLKAALDDIGVWGHTAVTKSVPETYLRASIGDRLALLQGLLDTDGSAEAQNARFSSISHQLALDVVELVRSLGGRATIGRRSERVTSIQGVKYNCREGFVVTLTLPEHFAYFRLPRKNASVKRRPRISRNALVSVERIRTAPVQCIAVDSPDHRYITNDYILTHNTGKTVGAAALTKYHQQRHDFDICFFVVKKHNKVNTVRKLEKLAGVEAEYVRGPKSQRYLLYSRLAAQMSCGLPPVVVCNYEQLKDFTERDKKRKLWLTNWGDEFFADTNVMIVWDEMPTKLKTRTSELYKRICKLLYRTDPPQVNYERLRPRSLRSYMLSATPIENSPEDWFNCLSAGTAVEPLGGVEVGYSARYKGTMVELVTAGAARLTIGPNHPVLTARGWVQAKFLTEGDQIVRRTRQRPEGSVEDLNDVPSVAEEILDTLRANCQMLRKQVARPYEFHGDGAFIEGEVEVVDANGALTSVCHIAQVEQRGELVFVPTHPDAERGFLGGSTRLFSADGVLLTSSRCLSGGDVRGVGVAPPDGDTGFTQTISDHAVADAPFCRELSRRFACEVTLDEVVKVVKHETWSGHIYDFQVEGRAYFANDILTSNCIRLMDGGRTYGTVSDFNNTYVASWNHYDPTKPETFYNEERMRLKSTSFVHQVDKTDPDIAAMFPKVIEELVYIDWDDTNAKVYDRIQEMAKKVTDEDDDVPIFSLIGTLQMMCDAPAMIKDSAARRELWQEAYDAWEENQVGREPTADGSEFALKVAEELDERLTNVNHPKLDRLREILLERHPGDQVAIYTKYNEVLIPYLINLLCAWEISHVRYSGTDRQKQEAQDRFQAGDVRVFISSDAGSDSIDLDAGNVVIDYNLPWKWTTLTQRHNRVHRATSTHDTVYYYTLLMENSVEDRVLEIIEQKHGHHNALFRPEAGDFSASARMSKQDLMFILTGR